MQKKLLEMAAFCCDIFVEPYASNRETCLTALQEAMSRGSYQETPLEILTVMVQACAQRNALYRTTLKLRYAALACRIGLSQILAEEYHELAKVQHFYTSNSESSFWVPEYQTNAALFERMFMTLNGIDAVNTFDNTPGSINVARLWKTLMTRPENAALRPYYPAFCTIMPSSICHILANTSRDKTLRDFNIRCAYQAGFGFFMHPTVIRETPVKDWPVTLRFNEGATGIARFRTPLFNPKCKMPALEFAQIIYNMRQELKNHLPNEYLQRIARVCDSGDRSCDTAMEFADKATPDVLLTLAAMLVNAGLQEMVHPSYILFLSLIQRKNDALVRSMFRQH